MGSPSQPTPEGWTRGPPALTHPRFAHPALQCPCMWIAYGALAGLGHATAAAACRVGVMASSPSPTPTSAASLLAALPAKESRVASRDTTPQASPLAVGVASIARYARPRGWEGNGRQHARRCVRGGSRSVPAQHTHKTCARVLGVLYLCARDASVCTHALARLRGCAVPGARSRYRREGAGNVFLPPQLARLASWWGLLPPAPNPLPRLVSPRARAPALPPSPPVVWLTFTSPRHCRLSRRRHPAAPALPRSSTSRTSGRSRTSSPQLTPATTTTATGAWCCPTGSLRGGTKAGRTLRRRTSWRRPTPAPYCP